jgi:hypothetical protein
MLESWSDMSAFSRSRARIHYAQIPLFPLSALAVITLVRGRWDAAAIICRLAMFVFAVSYIAFDTATGVVTGHIPSWGDSLLVRRHFWPSSARWHYRSARWPQRSLSSGRAVPGRLHLAGGIELWHRDRCDARGQAGH